MVNAILVEFYNCIGGINKCFTYVITLYLTNVFNIRIGEQSQEGSLSLSETKGER